MSLGCVAAAAVNAMQADVVGEALALAGRHDNRCQRYTLCLKRRSYCTTNAKKLACLQIASVLHAASVVVGRAHDASSKGKTRPLSSKDTTAPSHPALEIIAFAAASHWGEKWLWFHRYSQTDSIRNTIFTLTVVASCRKTQQRTE